MVESSHEVAHGGVNIVVRAASGVVTEGTDISQAVCVCVCMCVASLGRRRLDKAAGQDRVLRLKGR